VRLGLVVTAIALAGLAAAGACLPNLAELSAVPDASFEGAALPFRGCGDGILATLDDGGDAGESCDPGEIDADVPGCAACQITCEAPGGLDPATGHCYFVVGSDTSYNGALNHCRAARAHVVTFASAREVAFVEGVASSAAGYWVSLSRSPTLNQAYGPSDRPEEPGFPFPPASIDASAGPCEGCFGVGAEGGVFPIADVDASDTSCVASRGGAWFQVPCSSGLSRATVCEREPAGVRAQDCIGGFCLNVPATAGTKSYLVVVSSAGPEQAAQSCAGLSGGSLVVLGTAEEREQLAHEIVARDPSAVEQELWIGLSTDSGVWTWDDGVVPQGEADHRAPWGNAEPVRLDASASVRAYMRIAANAYDTQLAYADDGTNKPRLYICQRHP
jgi:hypothetical protein